MGGAPRRSAVTAPSVLLLLAALFGESLCLRAPAQRSDFALAVLFSFFTCNLFAELVARSCLGDGEVGRAAALGDCPTALHRHAAFFDRDGDGVVTLSETYGGMLVDPCLNTDPVELLFP